MTSRVDLKSSGIFISIISMQVCHLSVTFMSVLKMNLDMSVSVHVSISLREVYVDTDLA